MKKTIISMSILLTMAGTATPSFYSIVQKKENYDVSENQKKIIKGEWQDVGQETCFNDIELNEVYYGESFIQKEICEQYQERTLVTKVIYPDGSETIIDENTESRTITASETDNNVFGTHLEASCNDILKNGYSKGDGSYFIKPSSNTEFDVVCDMTTDDGGWTQIVANAETINTPNYKTEINSIWGDGVGKYIRFLTKDTYTGVVSTLYYKRTTEYTHDFYDNILATFRNTDNLLNVDFVMNYNYNNLNSSVNNFNICNYSNEPVPEHTYVGFPRDCNRGDLEGGRWITMDISRNPDSYDPFTTYGYHSKLWIK